MPPARAFVPDPSAALDRVVLAGKQVLCHPSRLFFVTSQEDTGMTTQTTALATAGVWL